MTAEQLKHAKRMRLAAMGRVPCKRCSGSGIHQSPTLTARVCGACGGRGYTIPRELSSGSWFEPEDLRSIRQSACACGECPTCLERERSRQRRAAGHDSNAAKKRKRGFMEQY